MSKADAAKLFPDKSVGDFVVDPLPPIDSAASPRRPPSR